MRLGERCERIIFPVMSGDAASPAIKRQLVLVGGREPTRAAVQEAIRELDWVTVASADRGALDVQSLGDAHIDAVLELDTPSGDSPASSPEGGGLGLEAPAIRVCAPGCALAGEEDPLASLAWPVAPELLRLVVESRCRLRQADARIASMQRALAQERRAVTWSTAPSGNPKDEAIGATGVGDESIERRKADEALRSSEARYRMLVETAPLDIVVVDRQGRFLFMNGHAAAPFGLAADSVPGMCLWDLFPKEFADNKHTHLLRVLDRGESEVVEVPSEIRGNARWFQSTIQPMANGGGSHDAALIVSSDVTEQRRLREELRAAKDSAEAANKAKTAFLANMSHELRTPLNAVVGYAQLLLETDLPPLQRRYARTVTDSGKLLMALVADILDLTKIEAGKVSLESVPFDLEELIEESVRVESVRLERKPVELVLDYPPDCHVAFEGDPIRMRQVVMNLLSNAGKFTSEGHVHVAVSCSRIPGQGDDRLRMVSIAVEDTGIGIADEKRGTVFEVFAQADSSTTRRYGGTGLGLAIVDRLVRLMGGRVEVRSSVGHGSTFTVELPLKVSSPARAADKTRDAVEMLRGRSVVVLSDNDVLAATVGRLCLGAGMRVAKGLPSALDQDLGPDVDLVVLDLLSRGVGASSPAFGLAEGARQVGVLGITSASQDPQAGSRMSTAGARLQRPVTRRALLEQLAKLVAPNSERAEPESTARPVLRDGLTVLVVEDNLVNQMLVRESLKKLGCRVDVASDGKRGLEMACNRAYDLVLMDVQMPVMDGLEAARGIRAHLGDRPPIIALTAAALKEDVENAIGAGMNDYLTKPIDIQVLRSKVALWVGWNPNAPVPVR